MQKSVELRFCLEYRKINKVRKVGYPLPKIDACLDAIADAQWFLTFELRSGYHQVLLDTKSSEKTTYITLEGTLKFHVGL